MLILQYCHFFVTLSCDLSRFWRSARARCFMLAVLQSGSCALSYHLAEMFELLSLIHIDLWLPCFACFSCLAHRAVVHPLRCRGVCSASYANKP